MSNFGRILSIDIRTNNKQVRLTFCYAPQQERDTSEYITFLKDLQDHFTKNPHIKHVLIGDMNAKLGRNIPPVKDKYGLHSKDSKHGPLLRKFAQNHNLTLMNSKFSGPKRTDKDREENKGKSFIRKMRSTVIGAGVLLVTALGTVLAESLGFIWIEENQGLSIWALLPALLAVAIDYYTSKLQAKAEQEE